ncbi:MAG: zinc ribbon domain-containing protein [Sphingomonas sp.]|nr:zinc ribbon domain-containing protein [Sphingomonas sp.]
MNPREEWTEVAAPELRIVDAADFAAVQARFAELQAVPLTAQRRPKRLLSGLVTCGVCGGSYIVIGPRHWGCGNHQAGKGCANNRVIAHQELDRRVLGALAERMLAPEIVGAWLAELRAEIERDRRARLRERSRRSRNHARAAAKVERLLDAIADGVGALADLKPRLLEAIAERDSLAAQLADEQAEAEIAVHPGIVEVFRRQLGDLEAALVDDTTGDARAAIRAMIENVRATPRADAPGVDLVLTGRLAAILQTTNAGHPEGRAGAMSSMVAGAGFEPAAFRL